MKTLSKILMGLLFLFVVSMHVIGQSTFFPATHESFQYIGRFDKTNPEQVRFDWPNSTIQFQFTGSEIALSLKGGARNYFNLFLNDTLHSVLHQPNDSIIKIKDIKKAGIHTLRLQKRTEGEMGIAVFKGVYLPKNEKLIISKLKTSRKIEFIGNSITCGYGTEGASRHEKFLPSTENVNQSYALITSKAFNADCHVIAHSGLGVVRNYGAKNKVSVDRATMPMRFNQILDTDNSLLWDFNSWKPDMLVINLGTNDYSTKPYPDKAIFQNTYKSLIEKIQDVYGNIPVFLICGPLIDEPAYTNIKELANDMKQSNPELNIHFIGIPKALLNSTSDLGSDSHPSYKGQLKMAKHIIPTIATVMDWDYNLEINN
ncbi:SGNH/GDSL hydrolase family protein [Mariniflexile sp.]|uniref:SGNH/GDSL hydrolase family protein n=1 Tax=Mariniflexile sp. TaxID=1979402 RepID=UPI0040470F64